MCCRAVAQLTLQQQLEGTREDLRTTQEELERLRRLVQEGGAASGETPQGASMQYGELAELYGRLLEDRDRIAAEAETMREELSAFDPAFFEELEDLKYDFEQVRLRPTPRPSDAKR